LDRQWVSHSEYVGRSVDESSLAEGLGSAAGSLEVDCRHLSRLGAREKGLVGPEAAGERTREIHSTTMIGRRRRSGWSEGLHRSTALGKTMNHPPSRILVSVSKRPSQIAAQEWSASKGMSYTSRLLEIFTVAGDDWCLRGRRGLFDNPSIPSKALV
jgi:hypothetical protein